MGGRAEDVRHAAKRSILNFFGTALGGSRDAAVKGVLAVLDRFSGPRDATRDRSRRQSSTCSARRLSTQRAATCSTSTIRITRPSFIRPRRSRRRCSRSPRSRPMTGEALLHAFVLGVEVECRLGNAVSPWHYKRGWHITSTCGVFGAAAAVAKVLGFDAERMRLGARQRLRTVIGTDRDARHDGQEHRRRRFGARRALGGVFRRSWCHRSGRAHRRAARLHLRDGQRGEPRRHIQGAGRDVGAEGEHAQAVSVRGGAVPRHRRLPRSARTEPWPEARCDHATSRSRAIRCLANAPTGPRSPPGARRR